MKRGRPPYPGLLTPREQEVLDLLRQGLTNRQIAERLEISQAGAAYHVSEILSKLGVGSRGEAAALGPSLLAKGRRGLFGLLLAPLRHLPLAARAAGTGVVGAGAVGLLLLAFGVIAMDDRRDSSPPVAGEAPSLGRLAYVVDGDIWVRDVPDGPPLRLTADGLNFAPRWSPSGEWLAYSRREGTPQDIRYPTWVSRADGSDARRIGDAPAAWSPVDDALAYVGDDGVLVVEQADGSSRRAVVTPAADSALSGPSWSPDGARLAYVSGSSDRSSVRLMVVGAGGGQPRELLREEGGDLRLHGWSGDGLSLFVWRGWALSASLQADGLSLLRVPVDGSGSTDLQVGLTYEDYVSVQPGGSAIAAIEGSGRNAWENKRLVLLDPVAGEQPLTPHGVSAASPAWSPDGTQIAYVAAPEATGVPGGDAAKAALAQRRIWIAQPAAGTARQVTADETYRDERPLWSRDGRRLLFARLDAEDTASVWVLSLASGNTLRVASGLSIGNAVPTPQPDLWFGYYGHIPWQQLFDWWQPT